MSSPFSANLIISNVVMSDAGDYGVVNRMIQNSVTSLVRSFRAGYIRKHWRKLSWRNGCGNTIFGKWLFSGFDAINGNFGSSRTAIPGPCPSVLTVNFADYSPIVRFNPVEDTWDPAFTTTEVIEYNNAGSGRPSPISQDSPGLDFTLTLPITCQQVRSQEQLPPLPRGRTTSAVCRGISALCPSEFKRASHHGPATEQT